MASSGAFTISLDFELMWGVFDSRSKDEYGANILGTRAAISGMLAHFQRYGVGVTWAAVGLLLCRDKAEMLERLHASGLAAERPDLLAYIDTQVGENAEQDPYHFATDILPQLRQARRQEVGSHSFAHYGLLEEYATAEGFAADMRAVKVLFDDLSIGLDSYIFARNQLDARYLPVLAATGVKAFRGCPQHCWYRPRPPAQSAPGTRLARLADSYLPLTSLSMSELAEDQGMVDAIASRFLRPWNPHLGAANHLQIARIKLEMSSAAQTGRFYHLWWHPHNFGAHTGQNLAALDQLLAHYAELSQTYGWPNKNMAELAEPMNQAGK